MYWGRRAMVASGSERRLSRTMGTCHLSVRGRAPHTGDHATDFTLGQTDIRMPTFGYRRIRVCPARLVGRVHGCGGLLRYASPAPTYAAARVTSGQRRP